jgi:ribosomal protein S18 acetylase RimI-like enzyme
MPEIQVRPATDPDITHLVALDHSYTSDYVWQMDVHSEENSIGADFRLIRLPRSVRVEYPRSPRKLVADWEKQETVLIAALEGELVGYACINAMSGSPNTNWITDLLVMRRVRRQGIGSTLVFACIEWARQHRQKRIILEMQPKNYPAFLMAQKLGFEFCGYNDRYYDNNDIALFFAKLVR